MMGDEPHKHQGAHASVTSVSSGNYHRDYIVQDDEDFVPYGSGSGSGSGEKPEVDREVEEEVEPGRKPEVKAGECLSPSLQYSHKKLPGYVSSTLDWSFYPGYLALVISLITVTGGDLQQCNNTVKGYQLDSQTYNCQGGRMRRRLPGMTTAHELM